MSKADDLRAMRERNWHARQKPAESKSVTARVDRQKAAEEALSKALAPPAPVTQECGHRSVGGKYCIRQKGHSEKQHKYAKVEKQKIDDDAEV